MLPAAALAAVAIAVAGIRIDGGDGQTRATLQLMDASDARVQATARLQPPDAAEDDLRWLTMTSWQGKEASVVQHMREVSPGVFRTTEPVPVDGNWKSILRLHRGDEVLGLPVFLPEDPAIPAKEVPATPSIDRAFILDKKNLQREQKERVAGWLTTASYGAVGLITLGLFGVLFWGLRRIRTTIGHDPDPPAEGPPFASEDGRTGKAESMGRPAPVRTA